MKHSTSMEIGNIACSLLVLAGALGYRYIGLPPIIIVGGSGLISLLSWVGNLLEETLTR
jgi:hypothetical protein